MAALTAVYQEMQAFFRPLWPGEDKTLVLGEGKSDRPVLMLIGEAPGETEVVKRRPFVGKAGKNLDAFLESAGLDRSLLYVTNTVKFRPTRLSAAGRTVNRPPTQEEVRLFVPWLLREIELVDPRWIIMQLLDAASVTVLSSPTMAFLNLFTSTTSGCCQLSLPAAPI